MVDFDAPKQRTKLKIDGSARLPESSYLAIDSRRTGEALENEQTRENRCPRFGKQIVKKWNAYLHLPCQSDICQATSADRPSIHLSLIPPPLSLSPVTEAIFRSLPDTSASFNRARAKNRTANICIPNINSFVFDGPNDSHSIIIIDLTWAQVGWSAVAVDEQHHQEQQQIWVNIEQWASTTI